MKKSTITVHAVWDDAAQVWTATSGDLPGLVTEAASLDELAEEVKVLVPQLLALQKRSAIGEASSAPFHRLVAEVPAAAMVQ